MLRGHAQRGTHLVDDHGDRERGGEQKEGPRRVRGAGGGGESFGVGGQKRWHSRWEEFVVGSKFEKRR